MVTVKHTQKRPRLQTEDSMEEDNLVAQADEVEALSSIYGDEWCVIDEAYRVYCINITDGTEKPRFTVCLQVTLPPDYPGMSPPHYQLNAPWIRGQERQELTNSLEEIYCDNLGETIIFMWVERIREFLVEQADKSDDGDTRESIRLGINQTEETDHDWDDDFHPDMLQTYLVLEEETSPPHSAVQAPVIHHGECLTDRRSTFQPHLAHVTCKQQVQMVINELYENKKIANATHNMFAYRIVHREEPSPVYIQGCEDDGETAAGSRMLHLLQIVDARNVLVVVSRWYGGIKLGPDRFKHINNCTRQILVQENCISEEKKDAKKSSKSSKKHK